MSDPPVRRSTSSPWESDRLRCRESSLFRSSVCSPLLNRASRLAAEQRKIEPAARSSGRLLLLRTRVIHSFLRNNRTWRRSRPAILPRFGCGSWQTQQLHKTSPQRRYRPCPGQNQHRCSRSFPRRQTRKTTNERAGVFVSLPRSDDGSWPELIQAARFHIFRVFAQCI